jgi:hypothetical protein
MSPFTVREEMVACVVIIFDAKILLVVNVLLNDERPYDITDESDETPGFVAPAATDERP